MRGSNLPFFRCATTWVICSSLLWLVRRIHWLGLMEGLHRGTHMFLTGLNDYTKFLPLFSSLFFFLKDDPLFFSHAMPRLHSVASTGYIDTSPCSRIACRRFRLTRHIPLPAVVRFFIAQDLANGDYSSLPRGVLIIHYRFTPVSVRYVSGSLVYVLFSTECWGR